MMNAKLQRQNVYKIPINYESKLQRRNVYKIPINSNEIWEECELMFNISVSYKAVNHSMYM